MPDHVAASSTAMNQGRAVLADTTVVKAPATPEHLGRSGGLLAGHLITGVVMVAAVGLGIAIGRFLGSPAENVSASAPAVPSTTAATVWTCSMHPQIRQPNPGKCPLCGMDLIPAEAGESQEATSLREISISKEARELLDLRVTPVERKFVTARVRLVGKVEYDETRLGYLAAWVPGRLDRLFVDYTGVEVKKGDHLVSIYSPELYSAQAELIRARQASQERRSPTAALSAQRLLESAREKLRLWGLTDQQIREIESREEPSDHLTIYAPMSGIVIQKNLQEGAYVETGTRIYAIADLSQVWVKLDAYESDLPWLRYGQQVEFTTEAYPGEVFTGTIAFIDPVLNAQTRTVKVRVNVPNLSGKLKPDMFVRAVVSARVATAGRVMDPNLVGKWICRMHPGVVKDAAGDCDICGMPLVRTESLGYVSAVAAAESSAAPLVVPVSAVLKTGSRAVVYVERDDARKPTYEGREVVLGPRAGDFYIIRAGLEEGDRVVTQGNFKLDSALQIAARPSMLSPDGAIATSDHRHEGQGGSDSSRTALGLKAPALTPAVVEQLERLQVEASKVAETAEAGDRAEISAALESFENALQATAGASFEGETALHWKELAARLRNDSVEARWAASEVRLQESIKLLTADMRRLSHRLGLPDTPATALAGGSLDVPESFQAELAALWKQYLQTQKALAGDDVSLARSSLARAQETLAALDMGKLKGPALAAWRNQVPELKANFESMRKGQDIAALRAGFRDWSRTMSRLVPAFGLQASAGSVYQLYCPMAFDNQGAAWLQDNDGVSNPYFGAEMLTCAAEVAQVWPVLRSAPPAAPSQELPVAFAKSLAGLRKEYLEAQDALAADDLARAKAAATSLETSLEAIDASSLTGASDASWQKEEPNLREAIGRMRAADSLATLRAGFALLSEEMPVIVDTFGLEVGQSLYQMHCPMAFDGRGASWLQDGKEPRNPYFGATMLRCVDKVEQLSGHVRLPQAIQEYKHD